MKTLIQKVIPAVIFLILFMAVQTFACGSVALIYKATFNMKSGESHTGFFEVVGLEDYCFLDENQTNEYCTDKGIVKLVRLIVSEKEDWLSNIDAENSFTLYRNIHYSNVKGAELPEDGLMLAIVTPEDKISINVNEIESAEFLEVEYSRRDYYTAGFLTGPKELAGLLDDGRLVSQYYIDAEEAIGANYLVLNFNEYVNDAEMKRLKSLKIEKLSFPDLYGENALIIDESGLPEYDYELQKAMYINYVNDVQEVQNWFYDWNIVVVEVWEGC